MRKYKLKNLDCANCALKIEAHLKRLSFVNAASVNFAASYLLIDTPDIKRVQSEIKKIEKEVEISYEADDEKLNIKKELFPLILVFIIFIAGVFNEKLLHDNFYAIPEYICFLSIFIFSGWKVLFKAVKNILKGRFFDENTLMSIATAGAIIIHALPEAAGVMLFFKLGSFFEELSVKRSRRSIKALLEIKSDFANVRSGDAYVKADPADVKPGDIILVKPGERVPLDGRVISGESLVDASALTGESIPKNFRKGDGILSGMISGTGSLIIEVTKILSESSASKILDLVENAVQRKAKTEKFITVFAKYYTPAVVLFAVLIAVIPPVFLHAGTFQEWIYRALVVLVISCPCALVISIPLGYFAGIGLASGKGILIKGSNYIDVLSKVKTVVFDKTGTLTKGTFAVKEIAARGGFTEHDLLEYAAFAESHSSHPIAVSIINAYNKKIPDNAVKDYAEYPGYGVKAVYQDHEILIGNDKFMHKEKITHDDCGLNETVIYAAVDGKYAGYIIIMDEEKDDALFAVAELRKNNIKNIIMLTGDNEKSAKYFADKLGMDEYYSELLPGDKVDMLERIQSQKKYGKIIFAGDGINDAPVLARADAGIAMGKFGSDAAIETADIVLMTDAPSKIAQALKISRRTKRIIIENIILSFAVKFIFIGLGAAGISGMWEAVFADVGVTVLAVLNTIRITKSRMAD